MRGNLPDVVELDVEGGERMTSILLGHELGHAVVDGEKLHVTGSGSKVRFTLEGTLAYFDVDLSHAGEAAFDYLLACKRDDELRRRFYAATHVRITRAGSPWAGYVGELAEPVAGGIARVRKLTSPAGIEYRPTQNEGTFAFWHADVEPCFAEVVELDVARPTLDDAPVAS